MYELYRVITLLFAVILVVIRIEIVDSYNLQELEVRPNVSRTVVDEEIKRSEELVLKIKTRNMTLTEQQFFINVTGFVVVQVDNRGKFAADITEDLNLPTVALLYNFLKSRDMEMGYVYFQAPDTCGDINGKKMANYWCKVKSIYKSSLLFPNAAGILFLDSDAFIGTKLWNGQPRCYICGN